MMAVASESGSVRAGGGGSSLFWLSLASGCTDVVAFLQLGNVFPSAMTGNTALLAVAVGRGQWTDALRALAALVAFAIGVAIGTILAPRWRLEQSRRGAFRRLLLLEIALLAAGAALWSGDRDSMSGGLLYVVIALLAVSMGIQAVGAGILDSAGISTIVFTTVLVHIVMSATRSLVHPGEPPPSAGGIRPHVGTFAAYAGGAALAAVLFSRLAPALIWFPTGAVVLALVSSELAGRAEFRSGREPSAR